MPLLRAEKKFFQQEKRTICLTQKIKLADHFEVVHLGISEMTESASGQVLFGKPGKHHPI